MKVPGEEPKLTPAQALKVLQAKYDAREGEINVLRAANEHGTARYAELSTAFRQVTNELTTMQELYAESQKRGDRYLGIIEALSNQRVLRK